MPSDRLPARRRLLSSSAALAVTILLGPWVAPAQATTHHKHRRTRRSRPISHEKEVTATEDLMREHGVLRRALLVYTQTVTTLRKHPTVVPPDALHKTAQLFRTFGEDYHERKLEEAFIFPDLKQAGSSAAALVDVLTSQHQRGREITDYVLAVTRTGPINAQNADTLTRALESLVLMYRNHAAREDTIVFPAWKQALSAEQLHDRSEKFEDIERQQFGSDGFEDAVRQIADIERSLGFGDLAQFTAPPVGGQS